MKEEKKMLLWLLHVYLSFLIFLPPPPLPLPLPLPLLPPPPPPPPPSEDL